MIDILLARMGSSTSSPRKNVGVQLHVYNQTRTSAKDCFVRTPRADADAVATKHVQLVCCFNLLRLARSLASSSQKNSSGQNYIGPLDKKRQQRRHLGSSPPIAADRVGRGPRPRPHRGRREEEEEAGRRAIIDDAGAQELAAVY